MQLFHILFKASAFILSASYVAQGQIVVPQTPTFERLFQGSLVLGLSPATTVTGPFGTRALVPVLGYAFRPTIFMTLTAFFKS
jgi:hypothetical protein